AREESCPHVVLPQGLAPRNAIGHLFAGLNVLTAPSLEDRRPEAARHLRSVREHVASNRSPVPEIAEHLEAAALPVLLAGDANTLCAARRWRASLAENAKVPATVWELPEAAHNRLVAAGRDGPRRGALGLLALGIPADAHARRRWDAVLAALEAHGAKPLRVTLPHRVPWIEALGLAYLGDWMSLDLAGRLGVDPEPLALMTDVKSRFRKGKDTAS
ncbi:MAG TPA: SIS domain-containing protein, partial [Candidatus Eisenbacteria bacterium]|nr:SIS domain-containing protein [Candidatus Eisenbacteria bacterium]